MATLVYNNFKHTDTNWTVGDYRMALLDTLLTTDPDHDNLTAVTGFSAAECTDASYGRVALTTPTRTVDDTNNKVTLGAATVDFTTLNNETVLAYMIFRFVTTDADHVPVVYSEFASGAVANGAGFTVTLPNGVCDAA